MTKTIYVWRAVRLVGYGPTRPTLVLPAGTPGFQTGLGVMALFTSVRQGQRVPGGVASVPQGTVPPNDQIPDANQGTFYSGMSNIDVEIGDGNPAAVGGSLSRGAARHPQPHGLPHGLRFRGAVSNRQPGRSPTVLRRPLRHPHREHNAVLAVHAARFGVRRPARRGHPPDLAGLTVIRTTFRNVPTAIEIDRDYSNQLWVKDSRFENVSHAAVVISNEKNALTQVGVDNAVCANVPVFARFRESGRTEVGVGPMYRVTAFNHGLVIPASGRTGRLDTTYRTEKLAELPRLCRPRFALCPRRIAG